MHKADVKLISGEPRCWTRLNVDETIIRSQCDEFARPVEILGLGALPAAGTQPDVDPITEAMFLADRKELVAYSACNRTRTWRRIDDE
jgi:hypothetical protein